MSYQGGFCQVCGNDEPCRAHPQVARAASARTTAVDLALRIADRAIEMAVHYDDNPPSLACLFCGAAAKPRQDASDVIHHEDLHHKPDCLVVLYAAAVNRPVPA